MAWEGKCVFRRGRHGALVKERGTILLQSRRSAFNTSKRMEAAANVCSPTTVVDLMGSRQVKEGAYESAQLFLDT